MHDVKVPLCMPEFSISKMIEHCFHVNNDKGKSGIGYEIIIGHDLVVQLGLTVDLNCQLPQWDVATVPMKEPIVLIGKSDTTSREMRVGVMQTAEPDSTRKATGGLQKNTQKYLCKGGTKLVANNTTQLNAEEITQPLRLLKYFEDLFGGTLGDWDTVPVDLELNSGSKPFNSKYYPFPRINKETFHKELKFLVKIGVLTPAQQSQYGTPVFIIPNKEGTVRFITDYRRLNQQLVRKPYPSP